MLGKPLEAFDVDLFFQHYPETIGYIVRIRELEPKDPVHKAKLAKERKAMTAYCKHNESEAETESQVLMPSEAKTLHAKKTRKTAAEINEADIYVKPEISEEKESMPSQSSDDNREENKGSYVYSDDVREENKGSHVHLSSSLPVRN